ncbi:uncharacterized protein LOC135837104 [Planococcus citri]|uniref:uncharacterized protein LOC135837104 n=1 Tax=Planococcus citri TaxID=170843 RepID=UPI0031F84C0F
MNTSWKLIFFVTSFIGKEITTVQSSDSSSSKYDLTAVLNDAIAGIFKSTDSIEQLETIIYANAPDFITYLYHTNDSECIIQTPSNVITIRYLHIQGANNNTCNATWHKPSNTIRWDLSKNQLHMFSEELKYKITGDVLSNSRYGYVDYDNTRSKFEIASFLYKNFSMIAAKPLVNQPGDKNITIDFPHDEKHMGICQGIVFKTLGNLCYEKQLRLMEMISYGIPGAICRYYNNGGRLKGQLDTLLDLNPKQRIISAYPNFSTDEQLYYYLIPNISLVHLNFRNVTIRGLTNFESYVNDQSSDDSCNNVYILRVKNITGNMILHSGFEHLPYFQLKFSIPDLRVSFIPKTENFRVKAQDYIIAEDAPETPTLISSWLSKYSTDIMRVLESELEDLMMPSIKNKSIPFSSQRSELDASFVELVKKSELW